MITLYEYLFQVRVVHDPREEIRSGVAHLDLRGPWVGIKTSKKPRMDDTQILLLFSMIQHRAMDFHYFIKMLDSSIKKLVEHSTKNGQRMEDWQERKHYLLQSFKCVIDKYTSNVNFWTPKEKKCSLLDKARELATARLKEVVAKESTNFDISSQSEDEASTTVDMLSTTLGRFQIISFFIYEKYFDIFVF